MLHIDWYKVLDNRRMWFFFCGIVTAIAKAAGIDIPQPVFTDGEQLIMLVIASDTVVQAVHVHAAAKIAAAKAVPASVASVPANTAGNATIDGSASISKT